MLGKFFIISVDRGKIKVKIAPVIPIGAPTKLIMIQTPSLLVLKTIKIRVSVIETSNIFT